MNRHNRTLPARNLAHVLLGSLLLSAVACDDGEAEQAAQRAAAQQEQLPNIKVELPPTPNFEEDKAPEKWPDGSFSIYGLRQHIDERLKEGKGGQDVLLTGWVQEIYVPPPCPEGETCPPGKQAFAWLTDHQAQKGKKRAMMVVKYRFQIPDWEMDKWKDEPQILLEEGKQYKFKGKFKRFSDTGFAHDRGLIEFVAYEATNEDTGQVAWVTPPGAPWHPAEVARQEEANAKLIKKASKDAKKQ
ncbi:MAG: hypothetical protein V3V08_08540 [Nannocystaceae bacterium]